MVLSNTDDNNMDRTTIFDQLQQSGAAYKSQCKHEHGRASGTQRERTRLIGNMAKHEYKRDDTSIGNGEQTTNALCNVSGDDVLKTTNIQIQMPIPIYRHTFTQEFINQMYSFSKIHQYDDRHSFKEAWAQWTEENKDLILSETRRLCNDGYDGNVMDKMFKSARYYFRKKSTEKREPIKRRNYIGMSRELLESMDNHIYKSIKNPDYKPSNGYNDFYEENTEMIETEIENWKAAGQMNEKEMMVAKIKKTYKNRYFVISNKNKTSAN